MPGTTHGGDRVGHRRSRGTGLRAGARHLRRGVLPRDAAGREGAESGRCAAGLRELPRRGRGGLRAGEPPVDGPRAPVPALAGIQSADGAQRPIAALEPLCRMRGAPPRQRPERRVRPVPPAGLPREDARGLMPGSRPGACSPPGWGCSCWRGRGAWDSGADGSPGWSIPSAASSSSGCSFPSRPSRSGCPGSSWPSTGSSASPDSRSAGVLAVATTLVVLGGHIQTSAHVLLAGGLYAAWRWIGRRVGEFDRRRVLAGLDGWGPCWGSALAAVQILPLAAYLSRSPVWGERRREAPAWWTVVRPRVPRCRLHGVALCLREPAPGAPQPGPGAGRAQPERVGGRICRAGDPDLAGPPGLPAYADGRRAWRSWSAMAAFGAMGAFAIPPVDNLLRACPVLDVTDNRRLTLWLAFGLTLLGGIGIDHLGRTYRLGRGWIVAWLIGAAGLVGDGLRDPRAGADDPRAGRRPLSAGGRAERGRCGRLPRAGRAPGPRARSTFLPRYYGLAAAELVLLGRAGALRRGGSGGGPAWIRPGPAGPDPRRARPVRLRAQSGDRSSGARAASPP